MKEKDFNTMMPKDLVSNTTLTSNAKIIASYIYSISKDHILTSTLTDISKETGVERRGVRTAMNILIKQNLVRETCDAFGLWTFTLLGEYKEFYRINNKIFKTNSLNASTKIIYAVIHSSKTGNHYMRDRVLSYTINLSMSRIKHNMRTLKDGGYITCSYSTNNSRCANATSFVPLESAKKPRRPRPVRRGTPPPPPPPQPQTTEQVKPTTQKPLNIIRGPNTPSDSHIREVMNRIKARSKADKDRSEAYEVSKILTKEPDYLAMLDPAKPLVIKGSTIDTQLTHNVDELDEFLEEFC